MTLKDIIEAGKKVARFPRDVALFLYALPTLRRMYRERDNLGEYDFYNLDNASGDMEMSFLVGSFIGLMGHMTLLSLAGSNQFINDSTIWAYLPLPPITNAISTFYEAGRLDKNRRIIERGRKDWERMVKEGGEPLQKLAEELEAKEREED